MVGDDAQAIYGFRGASPRYLLDAEAHFEGLTTITLDANYRSSAPILRVANALAADAPEGFCAVLREEVPTQGAVQPTLVHCVDERQQSEIVADRVLELYEEGVLLQRQAVLFRAANQSDDLEIELFAASHPVHQVRRPALPRSGTRQGSTRRFSSGR